MDDFADQERILAAHQRALNLLEEQAAPYTYSTIPVNKKIELDEKRAEVKQLKSQLEEARSAKQGIQPLDQIEVYSPSLIRVEKDALGIIEWKDNFQPPDENAEIKKGGFLYGEWPQLNNLYQGDFCPRDIYHEKADKIEEFTRKILRTNHLKIFWIGGRSGSGKSVALLYTLSILYKRGYEKILWLGHGASVSKLSAAFKYSKQLAKSNGHPILIGIDDPHIPGEQGDARQHWQDALNEITIELQTNNTEDITSLPVIVCCSPTERKDIFQELNEVSAYIEIEFSPMTSGQEDHQKFRDWYRKRTEKEPPVNDDQNLLLVQLFFELKSGEPINKFAESFKQRIIDSEKASEYFNDMTQDNSHQRLYDLFSEILALNRLYTTYPSRAVEERLSNSGMKVFNQLIDENHINLFQRKSQDEKDGEKVIGYMLSHPHLANAIYECWHHTTSSKNRNKHLQSAIRSSFKYGTNDHEKIAPLWALSNALKPESPNFKRLLYEPFDTSKKISYGLKRMHIHSLLESVYDYDSIKDDKGKIFLSYLLVWIQIELRCKKLELDVKKITENPPVNIAIETIKEVVSISSKEAKKQRSRSNANVL
jgi:hypothetical protein